MSSYLYSDDDEWSDDSSSDDDSTTTSVTVSDPEDPDWMKKFNLNKNQSDVDNKFSKKKTNVQGLKPADWLERFERVKDGPPSTNSPLPANGNGEGDSSQCNSETSSSDSDLKQDVEKPTDWLKKFQKVKGGSVCSRNASTQKSPPQPDLQRSNNLQRPIGEANKTVMPSRKTKKYHKSQPRSIDRSERRKRIRRNLENLRRRERIRQNLGTLQSSSQMQGNDTPPMTPTTIARVQRYERAIFKDMKRKISPPHKDNKVISGSSKVTNQLERKTDICKRTKTENKWSKMKTATKQIPVAFERNKRGPSFSNIDANVDRKAAQRQNVYDAKKQQKGGITNKVVSIVKSSYQRDAIEVPSIESKMNALRKAMDESKINEEKSYSKSDTKATVIKSRVPRIPNQNTNSLSPRIKATAPLPTHQKTDFGLTNSIPKKQIDAKSHSVRAEIENSVPQNLFGMWGDTFKTKKPTAMTNSYSDKIVKNQAERVKQRIENAKRGADGPYSKNKEIQGEVVSETKKGSYGHSSMNDEAAALFHAAGSSKSAEKNNFDELHSGADELSGEASTDLDDTGRYKESDGDDSIDENAVTLFYGIGSAENSENNGDAELKAEGDEFYEEMYEEISVDVDDSQMNYTMDDYAFASPLHDVGFAKKTIMDDVAQLEPERDELYEEIYEEISVNMDDSEMNDTRDDSSTRSYTSSTEEQEIEEKEIHHCEDDTNEIKKEEEKQTEKDEKNEAEHSLKEDTKRKSDVSNLNAIAPLDEGESFVASDFSDLDAEAWNSPVVPKKEKKAKKEKKGKKEKKAKKKSKSKKSGSSKKLDSKTGKKKQR